MSLTLFQWLCLPVLVFAYALEIRGAERPRARALEIAALVVAGWLAETTSIHFYGFYAYEPAWALCVAGVPMLVPLIWPMVVLSARAIAAALWPTWRALPRALAVGAIVALDASLMEVVAVGAGYWRWSEPGYLGVPLIGILGWGFFAICASAWLERASLAPARAQLWRVLALPWVAFAGTHALLLGAWWGALRWFARGDLGAWPLVGFGIAAAVFAMMAARSACLPTRAALTSRVPASGLFVVLLAASWGEPGARMRLAQVLVVALPYLVLTVRAWMRVASSTEDDVGR